VALREYHDWRDRGPSQNDFKPLSLLQSLTIPHGHHFFDGKTTEATVNHFFLAIQNNDQRRIISKAF